MTRHGFLEYEINDGSVVEVNYIYTEGEEPYISGLPEDCHDGNPPEIEIDSIMVEGIDIMLFFDAVGDYGKLIDAIHENEV